MNTRSIACQCPEVNLSEASTQVNEKMLAENGSCSVSRIVVFGGKTHERIIVPNKRFKIGTTIEKSHSKNDKFAYTCVKTRSIATAKPNFIEAQVTVDIPVPRPKPKIIANIKIPRFVNLLEKGKKRYRYLPKGMKFKVKEEEYVPEPYDPINNVTYVPTPINSEDSLDALFTKLEGNNLSTNREDIYKCKAASFRDWVKKVKIRNLS